MGKLVDTGGSAKLRELFSKLEERLAEEALLPTAIAMAKDAANRAPSPEQEFNTMMYGGWSGTDFTVRTNTNSFRGSDNGIYDRDGRIRFFKPSSLYLKEIIPTSFGVSGLTAWIGDVAALDLASGYSYVNVSGAAGFRRGSVMEYPHFVTYPFWRAWEMGGVFTISPHLYGQYPHGLKPIAGISVLIMTKTIPARRMYGGVNQERFVDSVLIPRIRRIVRSL